MAIYAIGDIQGCVVALEEMLDTLGFTPGSDQVWLTGDLVNRGAHSLETLRLVKKLGMSAVTVLGNHDLHLLAVAAGIRDHRSDDTLQPILRAPDRDELLHWLRHQPLVHMDTNMPAKTAKARGKIMMMHAGVYPGWRAREVARYAGEVETLLRGDQYRQFLAHMYGRSPTHWSQPMGKWQRVRFITNVLTRIRYVNQNAQLNFTHKGAPGNQPKSWMPWFMHADMKCKKWRIVFGHWSALGFFQRGNVMCLDSGCAWGKTLTAIRLDGEQAGKSWQLPCAKTTAKIT